MNKLPILIKREFWENRTTFLFLPALVSGFFMLLMLLVFTASATDAIDVNVDWDEQQDHQWVNERVETDDVVAYILHRMERIAPEERVRYAKSALYASSTPLFLILWLVVFFYLLNTLYDDRKDRSILFWKSLPVSDSATVLSKLVTGLVIVPMVYLAAIVVLHLFGIFLLTLGTIGTDIAVWDTLWGPASLLSNWLLFIAMVLFYSAWALPFYAWLLAVSAYAKSVPLAWALGVPFALMILERMFTNQTGLSDWMGRHMVPFGFVEDDMRLVSHLADNVFSVSMLSALVVGAALVTLAIWLRGEADEL